jgi:dTDP-4-dehydrorhamnose 3,5-epimerase
MPPDFVPVQNNISFNDAAGTTRGIHAEPWDKWVSVTTGRVFGAWVDLRAGPTFGKTFTAELDASQAVFVPRGVGNSYQTLVPATSYSYLVDQHWSDTVEYTALNLADESVAISWPVPLQLAVISPKDQQNPRLEDVTPVAQRRTLVVGSYGQLGRALELALGPDPQFEYVDRDSLDIADPTVAQARVWSDYDVIINAAAFTAVDRAETAAGRREAWKANVTAVGHLARIAIDNNITLVHISTDYVFDGTLDRAYHEDDEACPVSAYGQSKAAGDAVVQTVAKHYIIRTSWVIGDGNNFVRTMIELAERGINPRVVNDQVGRLTFTSELANAIIHLLAVRAPHGTYNFSSGGAPMSWADIAQRAFRMTGHDPKRVQGVSTSEYFSGADAPVAPRPANSVLDLTKIEATGLTVRDVAASLDAWITSDARTWR